MHDNLVPTSERSTMSIIIIININCYVLVGKVVLRSNIMIITRK